MSLKITSLKSVFAKSILLLPLLFFVFCQSETEEIPETKEALVNKDSKIVALMKSATEGSDEEQCSKFKYPIAFYAILDDSGNIEGVVINNDEELIAFFDNMTSSTSIQIDFPIVLLDVEGGETPVYSLEELEETLEVVVDACRGDEDDYEYCHDNKKKVNICHNGNTICVSINAIKAHLDHGDTLGSCDSGN